MNFFNKKQSGLFVIILFFMAFATSFLHVSNVDINSKVCGTIISIIRITLIWMWRLPLTIIWIRMSINFYAH